MWNREVSDARNDSAVIEGFSKLSIDSTLASGPRLKATAPDGSEA